MLDKGCVCMGMFISNVLWSCFCKRLRKCIEFQRELCLVVISTEPSSLEKSGHVLEEQNFSLVHALTK